MSVERWIKVAWAAHLVLIATAFLAYFNDVQPNSIWRVILAGLAVWLVYLLITKGPEDRERRVPYLLRYYFLAFALLFILLANAYLASSYIAHELAFKFLLLGAIIPFAILLRLRK